MVSSGKMPQNYLPVQFSLQLCLVCSFSLSSEIFISVIIVLLLEFFPQICFSYVSVFLKF